MSVGTLKTKVKKLAVDLAPHGFGHFGPYLVKRSGSHIDQFIEFQPGHGSAEGTFVCSIAWKFSFLEVPSDNTFHQIQRVTSWYPHEPKEALEESYAKVLKILETYAIPMLDSIDSIEKLIARYQATTSTKDDDALVLFPRDEGWKCFLLGLCFKYLGEKGKAREQLKLVVDKHSDYPYEWVARRKTASENVLSELA